MPNNQNTFPDRLEWAITEHQEQEGRQRGVRLFQRKMDQRGEELEQKGENFVGTTLSTIQNYLNGNSEPNIGWIQEAAYVLGVRWEWLATGEGPPTKAEAVAEEEAAVAAEGERDTPAEVPGDRRAVMGRRWREEYGEVLEGVLGGRVPALARATVAHQWRRLDVIASQSPDTRMDSAELLRQLASSVAAPLREAGVEFSELREEEKTDYVLKMVEPVAFAWKQALRQRVAEWIEETADTRAGGG